MKKITFLGILLFLFSFGCATKNLPSQGGGLLKNKNYSFAIYNEAQRLISHPIMDLEAYEKYGSTPKRVGDYGLFFRWA